MPAHPGSAASAPNRLIHEKSPYLLQHAYNPVDWYPWGEEAFARARREQKPIFLSIGYSTCHWCHVMERESFEDESVAAALARDFVAIKVDREERPDVDRIYMTAMQAMGMGGGWPLNVFLTPELEPFFGGTYFAPGTHPGRPGLLQLLPRVHQAWQERREDVRGDGVRVLQALAGFDAVGTTAPGLEALLERGFQELAGAYDPSHGGFGREPKFPSPGNLDFLLHTWTRDPARHAPALVMVRRQLDAMQAGGIHDQLGGGFHRYSTDGVWLVPHFEKMLYDQALLARAYLDAFQATREPSYAATARGILDYVARDLSSEAGGLDSAEDADSEGEEGKFYVWTYAELAAALGPADAELFSRRYGVTPEGNWEGVNVLHRAQRVAEVAAAAGISEREAEARLEAARARLLAVRERRARPHRDDKVIAAWNGLMISAFARGARVLGESVYAARASRAGEFSWSRLRDSMSGELKRRWREGEAAGAGQLDDYAYTIFGFLDLYGATFEPQWLERAARLAAVMIERFADPEHGGFFTSPPGDPSIRLRIKEGYDGAELAGGSIATWDLFMLGNLLEREEWRAVAQRAVEYYARRLERGPSAMPRMLAAFALARSEPRHVVIAGAADAADTRQLMEAFDSRLRPHDLLLVAEGGEREQALAELAPFVAPLAPRQARATAFVCIGHACRLPTTNPEELAAQLEGAEPHTAAKGAER
jgi:uncharacterized protein YyaL (SSP411 family)